MFANDQFDCINQATNRQEKLVLSLKAMKKVYSSDDPDCLDKPGSIIQKVRVHYN